MNVRLHRGGSVLSAIAVAVGMLVSTATSADAADSWSFNGAVSAPDRGGTTLQLKGDLTAPTGTPAYSGSYANRGYYMVENFCLVKQGTADPDPGRVFNGMDSRCKKWYWPRLDNGYYGQAPGTAQYIEVDLYAADGPGTYDLKIFTEDRGDTLQGIQGIGPISVVAETSRTPVIVPSASSAVVGKEVTVQALYEVTWSDGQKTQVPPARETTTLQARRVGDSSWATVSDTQTYTGKLTDSLELRYLIGGRPSAPTLITAIYPTRQQRFTSASASSQKVFSGSPVSLKAGMETLYTDEQWRPTPSQTLKVQFSANGKTGWATVGNAWVRNGEAVKNLKPTKTGSWRFLSGNTRSPSTFIRVLPR